MESFGRDGHRSRIRQKYFANGIEDMSDVHIVELFLSLVIPRRDVKPIAYSLLNRFGSLGAIFDAGYDELVSVDGVGDTTAVAIMLYSELQKRALNSSDCNLFEQENRLKLAGEYDFESKKYAIIFVNGKGEQLDFLCFDCLDTDVKNEIIDSFAKFSCFSIIIFRKGSNTILSEDVGFICELKLMLMQLNISIVDYIAVGSDDCVSVHDTIHAKLLQK